MSTGSKALDRTVQEWLANIKSGALRLPSFQRHSAWDRRRVASMLDTIIRDLPLGITLILQVGDHEQFRSRPLETAPDPQGSVTEHLLDGQQRLTALWRALKDSHDKESYFVHVPELDADPDNDDGEATIRVVPRWWRGDVRYPLWASDPAECLRQGLIPVRLLDPDDDSWGKWVDEATKPLEPSRDTNNVAELLAAMDFLMEYREKTKGIIGDLRETVRHFNLPYLRLPASTPRHVALSIFVNMNTNAKPLSAYDIVVAEVESATGRRLHEMVQALNEAKPSIHRYLPVGDAALQTSALMQGKHPNQRGFHELDFSRFVEEWDEMANGLQRTVLLLEEASIFDADRIPSVVPIAVASALLAHAEVDGDRRAVADCLARRYLWSSFFTNRYENSAATRAAADYRALLDAIEGRGVEDHVPVFDRAQHPLPTLHDLLTARWPKSRGTLARAVLAASNYFGARDFADDTQLSAGNVGCREYHHLFPDSLLKEANTDSYLALNCALITWKSNRVIGRLDPILYLEARAEKAPDSREVQHRLESHLVPYTELACAGPYSGLEGEALKTAVKADFDRFLNARAEWVLRLVVELCEGRRPQLSDIVGAAAPSIDFDKD